MAGAERVYSTDLRALGTHIRLLATDAAALPVARAMLVERLDELDCAASRFRLSSELGRINAQSRSAAVDGQGTVRFPVSSLLADHLVLALDVAARTGGLVTPTVGNELIDAGYDDDIDVVRSRNETVLRDHPVPVTADRVCGVDGGVLTLTAGVTLDLGCSAKAMSAQLWATEIAARIGTGILLDLGGDLASGGPSPRRGWQIGVVDWTGRTRQVLSANDGQAFATSSTRVRTWRSGATDRHHIIDPRTGVSAESPWAQVTCASTRTQWANAASTASVILGAEAPNWLSAREIPALLIAHDGTETRVGGWPMTSAEREGPA
ncbi:FAD:protein FMN transferase [Gordonia sp. CPCC 205515]